MKYHLCNFKRKPENIESRFGTFLFCLCGLLSVWILSGCRTAARNASPSPAPMEVKIPAGLKPGDTFVLGQYEQDNEPENGAEPVEWQVLSVENGRAQVISRYALDAKPYNNSYINVTWRRSSLRKWLNNDFFDSAFSPAEKSFIAEVENANPSNHLARTMGGLSTKDRIFLLSLEEANRYFSDDDSRLCHATPYARANGAYVGENGYSWWWLRSPGRTGQMAAVVLYVGYITGPGYSVCDASNVVRPAFWLDMHQAAAVNR